MLRPYTPFLLLLLIAQSAAAQLPSYVPTTGLETWYPFNGNSDDYSGNGNHGSSFNTTHTTDRHGSPNSAYAFNGLNSYVDCSNFFAVVNIPQLTVSAWFYSMGNVSQSRIISKEHYQNIQDGWHIGYSSGSGPNLEVNVSTNMAGGGVLDQMSINNEEWYHVAMVLYGPGATEEERLKMYLNGVEMPLDYYTPIPDFTSTAVYPLWIGNNYGFTSIGQWNGKIDDVGIWTTALTAQEIADLYEAEDLNVGLSEQAEKPLRIFPNPTEGVITVVGLSTGSGIARISNVLGEAISTQPFSMQMDVSDLDQGVYFLHVDGPHGQEVLRFVKD